MLPESVKHFVDAIRKAHGLRPDPAYVELHQLAERFGVPRLIITRDNVTGIAFPHDQGDSSYPSDVVAERSVLWIGLTDCILVPLDTD